MRLSFSKYEGLGNDFVVVSADADALGAADAQRLCDRHFGVGADGVLVVAPPRDGGLARMIVLNADGSRPEMCGNGLRCVAAYLGAARGLRELVVETDAGPKRCVLEGGDVEIDMGVGVAQGSVEIDVGGSRLALARVSMGNPHAITFDAFPRFLDDGLAVATHPAFPDGTNFEVVRVVGPRELDVVVWERGVGPTLACGTGACAVAVEACRSGRAPFGEPITVRLPGGALVITVSPTLSVSMRGPARLVFRGELDLGA